MTNKKRCLWKIHSRGRSMTQLICSRGCTFDTKKPFHRHLEPGMRCPMDLSYDRMSGTTYCGRILKKVEPSAWFFVRARKSKAHLWHISASRDVYYNHTTLCGRKIRHGVTDKGTCTGGYPNRCSACDALGDFDALIARLKEEKR